MAFLTKVLEDSMTEGVPLQLNGGVCFAILDHAATAYPGGTWTLQYQLPLKESPRGNWIDTDITFTARGIKSFDATADGEWRLNGTIAGCEAWFSSGNLKSLRRT